MAESPPLEWPPTGSAAVQALANAVDELEALLLKAGWKRLQPGDSWYAKRFAWEAVAGGPATGAPKASRPPPEAVEWPEKFGRFRAEPAWPEGTEALWRCEVKLDKDVPHRSSRFHAVVYESGHRRGRAIAASGAFRWGFTSAPNPNLPAHLAEVRSLTSALEAAGWEPAGRGASWYAERFVWRGSDEPPEQIELLPDEVDQGS